MRHIRFLAYDGILASGIAGPIDVFIAANATWRDANAGRRGETPPLFEWRVESHDGKPVRTASGQIMHVDGAINVRSGADALVVPGPFLPDLERFLGRPEVLRPLLPAVRRHYANGAVLATFCTGAFILAEAGLLDGRVATTHWAKAKLFQQRYPRVDLRADEVVTEHQRIICTGAVTTYLNLALKLVEKFAGTSIAASTARGLLIDTNRISQASYASLTVQHHEPHADRLVSRAQRWMQTHLDHGFSMADLARHLDVSERTMHRRFTRAVGIAPLRYLQSVRVEVAKRLLETKALTVDAVSERVGYDDVGAFRQLFRRETGVSPREYRRRFALRPQARAAHP
jgi:transcriptional regulator GlxA family with amidase domain